MASDNSRNYEMVTPEEFRQVRGRFKYPDLYRAIRALRKMATGEGIKIQCSSGKKDSLKRQKAVAYMARREKMAIRTMLRGEWLFIEKVETESPQSP
jgi:hypothetical protein